MSPSSSEELLDELRPVSFAIAYRMLGSVAEAEDVVQEALLRVHRAVEAGEQIESPRAASIPILPLTLCPAHRRCTS